MAKKCGITIDSLYCMVNRHRGGYMRIEVPEEDEE
jgi:hypothetical protein